MPYDTDPGFRMTSLRAVIEEAPGRDLPRWMRGLSIMAIGFTTASLLCTMLILAESVVGEVARPVAAVLAAFAFACGIAAVTARWAHANLAGRLDLLNQALESSAVAHLVVAPDGGDAYSNLIFRHFFPALEGPPLAAIGRRLSVTGGAAMTFGRLVEGAGHDVAATGRIGMTLGDGRLAWLEVSVHQLAERPGYGLWSFEDVTERHAAELAVRDEQRRLADFLDHAPVGFYSVDGDGRFRFVNQALADWLGAAPGELVEGGARLVDFLARPAPLGAPPHAPFASDEGEQRGTVELKGRQGHILHALISQSVLRSGETLRTRSVVRDLTPEREWQEALRQSRQRFQDIFADAPVGIALLDREGRLEEANRALCALFASPPGALIGKTLASLLDAEDSAAVMAKFAAAAQGEVVTAPVEVRVPGARESRASVFIGRLGAGEASAGGLILHFIDTTEQKSLQAQFAQSQKMQAVGQLAGGVAHDFNNLLTAMIGFCDLLLLRFRPGDPSFADIMQIKQNANRAANLVRQLLAFSRQQTLQPRILNITDVLAELSHLLRRLIGENIELKVVHARDLGLVKVDQGQLEQVIINLAVNARDAMTGGGTLTIRTRNVAPETPMQSGQEVMPPGHYVAIDVIDTGVGIPKGNLERIFEPFFSTKEVGSGTGLGLSTVYGIVKQTGGFVFVASEPGQGAAFSIFLPRHQGESEATQRTETAEAHDPRDLTGAGTVLLVEDEDPVRLFSARALRNKGYKVIEARSGEAALEVMAKGGERVDLLITDVVMPRMDGPSLIKEVRAHHPDMKVIFISGYAEDAFRKRLGDGDNIHFLAKPFSLKQLAGKVKEVMVANG